MNSKNNIFITYLGTASFLFEYKSFKFITDPGNFLTNVFTVNKAKSLMNINLVLITHNDFDHINRLKYLPGIMNVPIVGNTSLKKKFPALNIITENSFKASGIIVQKIKSIHGLRHFVEHTGYIIKIKNITFAFLGDAYKITEAISKNIDILFVTIGGIEASPENASELVSFIKPAIVIPMHWEKFYRTEKPVLRFIKKMESVSPAINYHIPVYDRKIKFVKGKELKIIQET